MPATATRANLDLERPQEAPRAPADGSRGHQEVAVHAIEIRRLRKRYCDLTALDGVDLTVEPGEIMGVVGPNGAGKSTLVECLVGLKRPDGGSVRVLGLDPIADAGDVRRLVGVQLQSSRLPDRQRVREALELFASFYADPIPVDDLIRDWGLGEVADRAYRKLSGGERQRLAIALALVGRPQLAVLDELTTGLDPEARRGTWRHVEAIRRAGVTVLLVTHFMDEAERLCDRIAVVDHGRLVAVDTPDALTRRAELAGTRLGFRPSAPLDDDELLALPGVDAVERRGPRVIVVGGAGMPDAVTGLLAVRRIEAADLRLEQASLEDAYLALTGGPS
jgi:ABC-2 type transport system ATP-binding protein